MSQCLCVRFPRCRFMFRGAMSIDIKTFQYCINWYQIVFVLWKLVLGANLIRFDNLFLSSSVPLVPIHLMPIIPQLCYSPSPECSKPTHQLLWTTNMVTLLIECCHLSRSPCSALCDAWRQWHECPIFVLTRDAPCWIHINWNEILNSPSERVVPIATTDLLTT